MSFLNNFCLNKATENPGKPTQWFFVPLIAVYDVPEDPINDPGDAPFLNSLTNSFKVYHGLLGSILLRITPVSNLMWFGSVRWIFVACRLSSPSFKRLRSSNAPLCSSPWPNRVASVSKTFSSALTRLAW